MNTSRRILLGAALAAALSPLPVLGLAPNAVAVDEPAVHAHEVVAVKLVGRGDYPAGTTDASMLDTLDRTLDFWEDQSDGALSFDRPDRIVALGSDKSCNDSTEMRLQAQALFPSKSFGGSSGEHLVLMMPPTCRTTNAAGSLGSGLDSGGYVVGAYLPTADQVVTWAHEFGHNLGLGHAQGRLCPDAGCGVSDYGDWYSTMGSGVGTGYTPRALSSFERLRLGLVADGEVQQVALEPGRRVRSFEVALRGRGVDGGLRGVRVTDPVDGSHYTLDFRNALGDDAGAYVAKARARDDGRYYNKGVTVQQDVLNSGGTEVSLLQAHPGAPQPAGWHYALTQGESFSSTTGGVEVTVRGMQLTGSPDDVATLRLTLTDPSVPLGTQTGTIAITEHGAVGSTVTATTAGWEDASLGDVQWYDDDVAIAGAVGPTYTIPAGMDGHRLTAKVTGTRESYTDLTATSNTLVVGKDLLVPGATYQIRSAATGLLVSARGPRTALDNVQAAVVDPPATNDSRWVVKEVARGVYQLKNLGTSTCLDDERARTTVDKPIIVWSCTSGVNQQWTLAGSGHGYALVNQTSKLALTPQADGRLVQSTGSYGWELVPVS